jgi:hypothetical protein
MVHWLLLVDFKYAWKSATTSLVGFAVEAVDHTNSNSGSPATVVPSRRVGAVVVAAPPQVVSTQYTTFVDPLKVPHAEPLTSPFFDEALHLGLLETASIGPFAFTQILISGESTGPGSLRLFGTTSEMPL